MFTLDDWHKLVLQRVNAKTVGPFPRTTQAQARDDAAVLFVFAG